MKTTRKTLGAVAAAAMLTCDGALVEHGGPIDPGRRLHGERAA
jgi:hypothetical protein